LTRLWTSWPHDDIPLPSQPSNVTAFKQAIPGIVKQRADAGKHVVYVDQYAGFTGKSDLMDSVRPYEADYEQMAVVWYAAICGKNQLWTYGSGIDTQC